MSKKWCFLISLVLVLGLYPRSTALATPLTDEELYFDPTSVDFDYYPRVILDDLAADNNNVWDAGNDWVVDADILPVLKPGTYPDGYSFSQDDYYQTPNVDYFADITDGTLTATFEVPGQYMVRVSRDSGSSQVYTVFAETGLLELPGHTDKTGPSREIPGPTGDVVIVATGDSTLDQAADNITNEGENVERATGVDDTIQKIKDAATAAGRKIHVELVGHGAPGMISTNNSNTADGDLIGPDSADIQEFQDAIDEYVDNISLFSCSSAAGEEGDNLLWILAASIGTASGWTVPITVEVGYFNVHYKANESLTVCPPARFRPHLFRTPPAIAAAYTPSAGMHQAGLRIMSWSVPLMEETIGHQHQSIAAPTLPTMRRGLAVAVIATVLGRATPAAAAIIARGPDCVVTLPPPAPATITVPAADGDGKYIVSWAASARATSYQLESSAPASGTTIYPLWVQVYSGTATSYAEKVGGGTWDYRVKAANACGCSAWTTGGNSCVVSDCLIGGIVCASEYSDWIDMALSCLLVLSRQCRGDANGKKVGTIWVRDC